MKQENFKQTTKALTKLTKQLQRCQQEKEDLLAWIEQLKQKNQLLKHEKDVRKKMASNLAHFEKTIEAIKKLKEEQ